MPPLTDNSQIGHGQHGLRSGMRLFSQMVGKSRSQKHAFVEIHGSIPVTNWTVFGSNVYWSVDTDFTFRGKRLDVIAVMTLQGPLERVDSADIAVVTAGKYYFNPGIAAPGAIDPNTGVPATALFIELPDSGVPGADQTIWAIYGFYYGSTYAVHPSLGRELAINGGFETTISADWTQTGRGTTNDFVTADTVIVGKGTRSAKISGTVAGNADALGTYIRIDNDAKNTLTEANATYRISGMYRNAGDDRCIAKIGAMYNTGIDQHVLADGRTISTSQTPLSLTRTNGEWRRFIFDVVAPGDNLCVRLYLASIDASGASGAVWFDDISIKRIYRWEEYTSRLSYKSLPPLSEGRRGAFFDQWQFGQLSVVLNNGDDLFEELFQTFGMTEADVIVRYGGRFSNGGNDILIEDMLVRRGAARRVQVEDDTAVLEVDDARKLLAEPIPRSFINPDDNPSAANEDMGKPVPWAFGALQNIKPLRVALDGSNRFGVYMLADPAYAGISSISGLRAYLDGGSAQARDLLKSKGMSTIVTTTSPHYDPDEANGVFTVLKDVRPHYTEKTISFDFDIGGAPLTAAGSTITSSPDSTFIEELCAGLQTSMNFVAGTADITVGYAPATALVTIAKGAGTLNLLLQTGPTKGDSGATVLGFESNADLTGALTYTGTIKVLDSIDTQHIIRANLTGYVDDGSGTYTGTPGAPIKIAPDIMHFVLSKVFLVPDERLNLPSFVAARSGCDDLAIYLDQVTTLGAFFQMLEESSGVELLQNGDVWSARKRDATTPAGIITFRDPDIISCIGWRDEQDFYSVLEIGYARDVTGKFPVTSGRIPSAFVRLNLHDKPIRFNTALPLNTYTYLDDLALNVGTPRRRFRLVVRGAFLLIPGDKVILDRNRFLGKNSGPCLLRILNDDHDSANYVSTLECAEVLGAPAW
jgi:hypothetical protein